MRSTQVTVHWKRSVLKVLLFCLCCAVLLIVGAPLTRNLPKPWSDLLLGAVATLGVFGFTVVFSRWEKLNLNDIGVRPRKQTIPLFAGGFAIGLLLAITHGLLVLTFAEVTWTYAPSTSFVSILLTLLLYLTLALREELAFRGYALRSLVYAIGPWKAQGMIALIFALEHLAGGYTVKQAFLGAGIGAILFGIAALKSKGIALPVGLHAAWNFGQWATGLKNEPGIWQTLVKKGYEAEYENLNFAFYLVVMVLAIGGFCFYKKGDLSWLSLSKERIG